MPWRDIATRLGARRPAPSPLAEPTPLPEPDPAPPAEEPPPAPPSAVAADDGAVWVEDGVLHVREPVGRGRWPSIVVPADAALRVLVNGRPATGQVVLRAVDDVVLDAERREEPPRMEVEVDADEMAAWVTVFPGLRVDIRVPDAPPQVELELRAAEEREVLPHGFGPAQVEERLLEAGVRYGVDPDALVRALQSPGERVRVAQGEPAGASGPARVWSVVHGDIPPPEAGTAETPGAARDVGTRRFVTIGQPVVQVEPAGEAHEGRSVTGRPLPAPAGWQPTLVAGPGALLSADGRTAIATRSGHPDIRVEPGAITVAVHPEHRVAGDLTAAAGVLRWDGDVWIEGGIQPGAHVVATRGLEVRGRALRARMQAGGSIRVGGGITHCAVVAGGPITTYAQILPLCAGLETDLALEGPRPAPPRTVGAAALRIADLLDQCEADLGPELAALLETVRSGAPWRLDPERRPLPRATSEALRRLAEAVRRAAAAVRQAMADPGSLSAAHLENARVEATGAVEVGERGLWRSHVVCGGPCVSAGPVRGGTILALGGADLPVIGSGDGWDTRVEVGPGRQIRAGQVHPGAVLVCGAEARTFETLARDVVVGQGPAA